MPMTQKAGGGLRKVVAENVNIPGYKQSVDAAMYEEMKRAMLLFLPSASPGLTYSEIRSAVSTHLSPALYPGGAKAGWWLKLVQLDLEAKGVLCRIQTKPLRWYKS